MAVMRFGSLYACSRCPGWQTDAVHSELAITHAKAHLQADIAACVCPVCLSPWHHTRQANRATYAEPCGHLVLGAP